MFDCLKFGGRFLKLGIAMLIMVCVGFGLSHGWQKLFVENDEFLVKEVSLKTMEGEDTLFLNHERLEKETNYDPADTIFAIDTDELEGSLLKLPEVMEAKVSRRLPGLLKIEVAERMPVAWVACRTLGIRERDRDFGLLVDADGFVFPCASESLWSYAGKLPVIMIQAAEKGEIVSGETLSQKGLKYALQLVNRAAKNLKGSESIAWVSLRI